MLSDDDAAFAALRAREYARLDEHGIAYLDHAAAALYSTSQLRAHHALLAGSVLGNPHSQALPSRTAGVLIEHVRDRVLAWLDVDATTHAVCFTANASAALKLVAEAYLFGPTAGLVLAADNHNSVTGMREYARRAGASIAVLPLDADLRLAEPAPRLAALAREGTGLVALPAQSNFSGVRHPLELVAHARALGFDTLLDAAAFVPTHALSLRTCPADFTVLSFTKVFGFPVAGALVARRDALARLRRPWFAGGTVVFASVGADTHRLTTGHAGFEDGTPDFLGIAALEPGFALLDEIGMPRITTRIAHLTRYLLDALARIPEVRIYGPRDLRDRGGTIALNVPVSYTAVEERARAAGVALRGGCFCNPGASEAAFMLPPGALAACLAARGDDEFSPERLGACLGRPVGALRLSLGVATNRADIDRAVAVLAARVSTST